MRSFLFQAFKANVLQQILEAKESLTTLRKSSEALALIIDGKSLSCALEDDVKGLFLELALGCASVICCRCSPKQKALVRFSFFFYVLLYFQFRCVCESTYFTSFQLFFYVQHKALYLILSHNFIRIISLGQSQAVKRA